MEKSPVGCNRRALCQEIAATISSLGLSKADDLGGQEKRSDVDGWHYVAIVAILSAALVVVVIVWLLSKNRGIFKYQKNETHSTRDYHRTGDGDNVSSDNPSVLDIRQDVGPKFKNRGESRR